MLKEVAGDILYDEGGGAGARCRTETTTLRTG